jgi:hypothetical protein
MSRGILLFSFSGGFDYYTLTIKSAQRLIKHLNLPITVITDDSSKFEDSGIFHKVIEINDDETQLKKFHDGKDIVNTYSWKNSNRFKCFELTPYNETLVLDVDYIVNSSFLLKCFDLNKDFLLFKESIDISGWKRTDEFSFVNQFSVPFYWATVFYFKKTSYTEMFFNLVEFIKDNWEFYRLLYQIKYGLFRNDFAFSIAIHILSGFVPNNFDNIIPYPMYFSLDKDILIKDKNDSLTFVVSNISNQNDYSLVKYKNVDIHVMNKQSLLRELE